MLSRLAPSLASTAKVGDAPCLPRPTQVGTWPPDLLNLAGQAVKPCTMGTRKSRADRLVVYLQWFALLPHDFLSPHACQRKYANNGRPGRQDRELEAGITAAMRSCETVSCRSAKLPHFKRETAVSDADLALSTRRKRSRMRHINKRYGRAPVYPKDGR